MVEWRQGHAHSWGGQSTGEDGFKLQGLYERCLSLPNQKEFVEAASRVDFPVIKALCRGRDGTKAGSPSLYMDTGRVKGHSSRLPAATAVGVQSGRDRWLWALGLQLPPGPHSPVTNKKEWVL